jgi:PDDEXK-like domain of unknown function (DUF3799)
MSQPPREFTYNCRCAVRTIDDIVRERSAQSEPACFVRQEPLAAYLAESRYISASRLRRAMQAGGGILDLRIEEDPRQRLAQALHALVLEPARFAQDYFVPTATPRGTTPPHTDSLLSPESAGALEREWLSASEYATLCAARAAIYAYRRAPIAQLLADGVKELSIYWTDEAGRGWKARPDCFTDEVVVELKTTVDVRPRAFAQIRHRFGYDLKAAHYIDGMRRLTGVAPRFLYVAVELNAPHYVWVYELSASELARAEKELRSAKARVFGERGPRAASQSAETFTAR